MISEQVIEAAAKALHEHQYPSIGPWEDMSEDTKDGNRSAARAVLAAAGFDRTHELIAAELASQDRQWGGPAHDDQHQPFDWVHFLDKQLTHATRSAGLLRNATDEIAQGIYTDDFRERLVKIAALAIAGIRSTERNADAK